MIIATVLGLGLLFLSVASVELSISRSLAQRVQREAFIARQIADSAVAQALAKIREGGLLSPWSGSGSSAAWVSFSGGQYFYTTTYDSTNEVSVIRAWGKVQADPTASSSTASPDDLPWDGTGWLVKGLEVTVRGNTFVPTSPAYFGNGGVERPAGGFDWNGTSDPADPSTWGTVTGSPSSYQASSVPFSSNALDHVPDYLYQSTPPAPTPASTNPHPYNPWTSQTAFGQANVEAWFANSAGSGSDPTTGLTPPPTNSYYDTSDSSSPDYPYPINSSIPDVQDFAWEMWSKYKNDSSTTKLGSGVHSGTYGDYSNPGITFVTGKLEVDPGQTFKGAGILVIRDDFHPAESTNNNPGTYARMKIEGNFEWTGLVIVAGWKPEIEVTSTGNTKILGSLFGEDSVMSGGEVSLDSATIIMKVNGPMSLMYSNALFASGGMVHNLLPKVAKEVVGIIEI